MENKQIIQLMLSMGRYGITKLVIKREGVELELERQDKVPLRVVDFPETSEENLLKHDFEKHRTSGPVAKIKSQDEEETSLFVTAPMVGTLYHSPSPQDPPFVKVGDRIEKNTVVCIIEAMKVMNEIKAQVAGTVAEVLVENGDPVEFGTKIFKIIPNS